MAKADIVFTAGLDTSGIERGARMAGYRLGAVSQQVQDMAVQMGNATDTIKAGFLTLAQQGPQIASIFGNNGMMVGGVIAIGGAFAMAAYHSAELFKNAIKGAQEFHDGIGKVLAVGGINELDSKLGDINKKIVELGNINGGIFKSVGTFLGGGGGIAENAAKVGFQTLQLHKDSIVLGKRAVEISDAELRIQNLITEGKTEQARIEKEGLELTKKRAQIEQSNFSETDKKSLIENAQRMSVLKDEEIANKKVEEQKKADDAIYDFETRQKVQFYKEEEKRIEDIVDFERKQKMDFLKEQEKDAEGWREMELKQNKQFLDQQEKDAKAKDAQELKQKQQFIAQQIKDREEAEEKFKKRALTYADSFSAGRRADREAKKEADRQLRGENRLRKHMGLPPLKAGQAAPPAPNLQPNGAAAAVAAAGAGNAMNVQTLNVKVLRNA